MNNIRNIHYEFNLLFSNKHQIVGRRDLVNSRRMSIGFLKELCPIIFRGERCLWLGRWILNPWVPRFKPWIPGSATLDDPKLDSVFYPFEVEQTRTMIALGIVVTNKISPGSGNAALA